MKLKKGDVYKWPTSDEWFKIKKVYRNDVGVKTHIKCCFTDGYSLIFLNTYVFSLIHTGKLIKIPQLYK